MSDGGIKIVSPKFESRLIFLSILDICMHNTYTLQARPMDFKPDKYALPTWTTQVAKVPRPTWMEVYNQFEPALKKSPIDENA